MTESLKEHLENPPKEPEYEPNGPNPPVTTKKTKTKQQRRLATQIKNRLSEKMQRKQVSMNHEYLDKFLKGGIVEKPAIEKPEHKRLQKIKFGMSRYTPELEHVQTTDEIADSLRQIQTDSNLIHDRFTNVLKKKFIEPPMKRATKKEKTKTYNAHNAKDEDEIITVQKLRKIYGNGPTTKS